MELDDILIYLLRELRHPGSLEVRHGPDHVLGLEDGILRLHHEPITVPGDLLHPDAGSHREVETRGVGLQIVRHLVLGRERPAVRREGEIREPVVPRRGKKFERVPAIAPRVADTPVRLQDHVLTAPLGQLMPHREPSLPAADYHRLKTLHARLETPASPRTSPRVLISAP